MPATTCQWCEWALARNPFRDPEEPVPECPHTTKNFKVGDKVHVVPREFTPYEYCIRAVVVSINDCYHLKAFLQDLPGVWMFNIWDGDLVLREGKGRRPAPPELLIKPR